MRKSCAVFAIGVVLVTTFLSAEEGTSEALPQSTVSFLLTPATPSVSREIVIDRATRADILVTAMHEDLEVVLISPRKTRFPVIGGDSRRPDFESWISPFHGLGANYRAIFTRPEPGRWILEVRAKALTSPVPVVVNTFLESEIFSAMTAGELEQRVGEKIAVSLVTFEGSMRLRGIHIDATISAPGGSAVAAAFRDDGVGADFAANDGVYTALVHLPREGEYHVRAIIRGVTSGTEFQRTASTSFYARRSSATLTGTFTDRGVDEDVDGLFDAIIIAPAIDVVEPSEYVLTVGLRSTSQRQVQQSAKIQLGAGSATPQVSFDADSIREQLAEDGPYTVDSILLERWDAKGGVLVDSRTDAGLTYAYRLNDLHRVRVRVPETPRMTGVDANANGLYDSLRIEVDVHAEVAGTYWVHAGLTDTARNGIGQVSLEVDLAVGKNTVSLLFDGATIGRNRADGPFGLTFDLHGPATSLGGEWHLTTPTISAALFEGFLRDSTPPTINVSVTPSVLWPPDHRMVEIVPVVTVQDEHDQNPVVRLETIKCNEEPNQLGDGSFSIDMQVENDRIFLRAERSGSGSGRTYTLEWSARDRAGNVSKITRTVTVPISSSN